MTVTGSTKHIDISDNDAVTASTKTRKVIIVGATGHESAHILAAIEKLKRETEVELITPEEAVERGITISSEELFRPEPFVISDINRDHMYLDYDGKYDKRKGKQGYTRPYKYHK